MHRLIAIVATLLLSASALAHAPRASVGALPFGEPTQAAQRIEAEAASPEPHALENLSRQQKTAHPARARLIELERPHASALTHCLVLENWLFGWKCASGTTVDPWGLVTSQSGEQSKLGHGNYQREPDNHYQAIARWYRPGLGRFMSMDPINGDPMQPGTLNEYLAMLGSPTQFVDPDGRQSIGIGVRSCSDTGACAATQMAASALPLLNPSQMATPQQADALIESQARMALFSPGRPDSAMVAQPLLASGAGRFERPYVANSTARQLSAMQSSADLDQALGLDPNYVAYGQGTEAAGAAAVSSIPPFAVIGGVQTMAAAENPWEFAFGATEALLGAVPMAMAARAEAAAFRAERMAMANRSRARVEGTTSIRLTQASDGDVGIRFNDVDSEVGVGQINHPLAAAPLGNRKLPSGSNPWIAYQQHVTGRSYEEVWKLGLQKVAVDGRRAGVTVEAKWTGRDDAAFSSSPYSPSHRFYDEAKIVEQARDLLELNKSLKGDGVRYAVSNDAARVHFEQLFEKHFAKTAGPEELKVYHVPGTGMRTNGSAPPP